MKRAVFPGTFDPITLGHVEIVKRAVPLFDEVTVAIGVNANKKMLFSLEKRLEWLEKVFAKEPKVKIDYFQGLTAKYCKKVDANYLIRGLRNSSDFDYEKVISQVNNTLGHNLDTIFLISQPNFAHISSSIVRELINGGADVTPFVPGEILEEINELRKSK